MTIEKQRRAFISYSRTNKEFATKLTKRLKSAGYPIWFDLSDIPTGSRWDDEVEKALRECSIFMIILTPASISSENVKDEIGYAIDHGKRILPILLELCEVPLRLRRFQYVDFTTKSFEEGIESAKELLGDLVDEASVPIQAKVPVIESQTSQNAQSDHFRFEREKLIMASTLLAQGKQLFWEEDWQKAVQTFQQVLILTPNHEETQTLLSNAEAKLLQKAEADDKSKKEAEQIAKQNSERESKADAERLAKQQSEEERLAQVKLETERKVKEESDRFAAQKVEVDRFARQQAEDERLVQAKAKIDFKVKQESDRLATQKIAMIQKALDNPNVIEPSENKVAQKTKTDWLQTWWVRGLIAAVVGDVLGLVTLFSTGGLSYFEFGTFVILIIALIISSIPWGIFGLIFYPNKTSYILLVICSFIFFIVYLLSSSSFAFYLGVGSGLVLGAIISRILHVTKVI
jgi:hypothetical protein